MHRLGTEDSATSNDIIQRDPILRFFMLKLKWSTGHIIVFMALLAGVLFFGVGAVASYMYTGPGNRLGSSGDLGFQLYWVFVLSPILWGAYIWQARNTPNLVENLLQNGVLGDSTSGQFKKAINQSKAIFDRMLWRPSYIVAALLIVLFWLNSWLYGWPQQFAINREYWFDIKWYLPIHLLTYTIGLFVLLIFIFRQVVFVVGLYRLFKRIDIKVKPLDPDESGGLGVIGDFAKSSLLFAIGLGLIAVSYGTLISVGGADLSRRLDVLAFYGIYIILAPVCLLAPIFSVRSAMLRARSEVLRPIAQEFQETLARATLNLSTANPDLKDLDDKLIQLQRHRELILETYPTLPIAIRSLRRFSLTALLPLASGILSLALQLIK